MLAHDFNTFEARFEGFKRFLIVKMQKSKVA